MALSGRRRDIAKAPDATLVHRGNLHEFLPSDDDAFPRVIDTGVHWQRVGKAADGNSALYAIDHSGTRLRLQGRGLFADSTS